MDSSVAVCSVARKANINHFDDLFKKKLRIGATGRTGPFRTTPKALKRLLGIKLNIVAGYKGAVAVRQAILRGKVDGACGPSMSAVRVAFKELTERGDFKIILPADRASALRKAFNAAVKDPELVAQAKRTNMSLNVRPAEEIAQIVNETYATPKKLVARARKATGK